MHVPNAQRPLIIINKLCKKSSFPKHNKHQIQKKQLNLQCQCKVPRSLYKISSLFCFSNSQFIHVYNTLQTTASFHTMIHHARFIVNCNISSLHWCIAFIQHSGAHSVWISCTFLAFKLWFLGKKSKLSKVLKSMWCFCQLIGSVGLNKENYKQNSPFWQWTLVNPSKQQFMFIFLTVCSG